ncbi:branched-chain amino acid ABC transporter permease, partial [Candidatus Poribacteria bacterium]|nr:branched-chain amino acid ABC transporter permease [Candidatus Poribacteria bacterium]
TCALLGVTIEFLAYRPLRNAPRLNVLITAIGVSLFLENAAAHQALIGTQPAKMPEILTDATLFTIIGVPFRLVDVLILVVSVVIMAGLELLIHRTKIGLAMRAVSQDMRISSLMGINVNRTIAVTFRVGSALAGAAGFLQVLKYPSIQPPAYAVWVMLGLKAFVAAVVGGIGNVRGAMLGGMLIGMIEMFGAAFLSPQLRDVYVFVLLILVLLVKPTGIMGKLELEKV